MIYYEACLNIDDAKRREGYLKTTQGRRFIGLRLINYVKLKKFNTESWYTEMKNYASNRAQKGKTAFRTPSLFKANKAIHYADLKSRIDNKKIKSSQNYYEEKAGKN